MDIDESKQPQTLTHDEIEAIILTILNEDNEIPDSIEFSKTHSIEHSDFVGVMKSLAAAEYVTEERRHIQSIGLSDEGKEVLEIGSAEFRLFSAIESLEGEERSILEERLGRNVVNIGMGPCMKQKWITRNGSKLVRNVEQIEDETQILLQNLSSASPAQLKTLKKRKLAISSQVTTFKVTKGPLYNPVRVQLCRDLTVDLLQNDEWENVNFKPYNFHAMGLV